MSTGNILSKQPSKGINAILLFLQFFKIAPYILILSLILCLLSSVKYGFKSFLNHPTIVVPNTAKLADYKFKRCKWMYKHTDKMEMETIKFLQSVPNASHAVFEANFFKESKKW